MGVSNKWGWRHLDFDVERWEDGVWWRVQNSWYFWAPHTHRWRNHRSKNLHFPRRRDVLHPTRGSVHLAFLQARRLWAAGRRTNGITPRGCVSIVECGPRRHEWSLQTPLMRAVDGGKCIWCLHHHLFSETGPTRILESKWLGYPWFDFGIVSMEVVSDWMVTFPKHEIVMEAVW